MTTQNYLVVQNNIVTNCVVWDGDVNTWTPPTDATILIQATTPAIVWQSNNLLPPSWVLTKVVGAGGIEFTWDGTVLITYESKPVNPPPIVGTQSA
jgi:hypothetical protein